MKRTVKIIGMLLMVAALTACSNGSSYNHSDYSYESENNNSSSCYSDEESSWDSERNTNNTEKRNKAVGNEISKILNTKWQFTDAAGNDFILKVNDLARDGKTAKAELLRNGETNYVKVEAYYNSGWGEDKEFIYYEINPTSSSSFLDIYYTPDSYETLLYSCWDYDNGYLYSTASAFNVESPKDRLAIKKKR